MNNIGFEHFEKDKENDNIQHHNYREEKNLKDHPKSQSLEARKIITQQMENSFCKIKCKEKGTGTGFFAKILFQMY